MVLFVTVNGVCQNLEHNSNDTSILIEMYEK